MIRWMRALLVGCLLATLTTPYPASAWMDGNPAGGATAISVARSFPPDMAGQVSPTSPLTVEFVGPLTPAFYQTINFTLLHGTLPIDGDLFYNPAARQVMFKPRQALPRQQTFTAQVSFHDGLGQSRDHTWNFRTDDGSSAPVAANQSAVKPPPASPMAGQSARGEMMISGTTMASGFLVPEAPLEIQFSEPLDIGSLRNAPIRLLTCNQPLGIDYRLSRDMKTLTLVPRQKLAVNEDYQVALSAGLSGVGGQQLAKNTLIPFRISTKGNPDILVPAHILEEAPPENTSSSSRPPANMSGHRQSAAPMPRSASALRSSAAGDAGTLAVTGLQPAHAAEVTNLTQPVTVVFNREVRPETLNEFTFRLEDDFGPVPAKIQYFAGRRQGTLTPVGILDANRTYRVVITQGVTDDSGKPLGRGVSSSFLVASPAQAPKSPALIAGNRSPMAPAQGPSSSGILRSPLQDARELEVMDADSDVDMFEADQTSAPSARRMSASQRSAANRQTGTRQRAASSPNPFSTDAPDSASRQRLTQSNPQQGHRNSAGTQSLQRTTPRQRLTSFKVEGIVPGSQAADVPRHAQISIHFSEQVDPRTINGVNISVFGHQDRVEGMVKYDATQRRAIFTPARPLDPNTNYKVRVSDKITSAAGEPLPAWFSWNFATANETHRQYVPRVAAEADAAFFIPLVDSRLPIKPINRAGAAVQANQTTTSGQAFSFIPSQHWVFKSLRHIVNKGMLKTFPFRFTESITRYEFANAISSALSNLKAMQSSPERPQLKIADLVELQKLVIEFQPELKSYGINSAWFEVFLQRQGIKIEEIRRRVQALNQKQSG